MENDSNKVNVGRLHRIINQKLKDGIITEENTKPQEQYTVLGRQYSKFALVVEYLNIRDFEGYTESSYFVENQERSEEMLVPIITAILQLGASALWAVGCFSLA